MTAAKVCAKLKSQPQPNHHTTMHVQTIHRDKKTGAEFPVSIRCAWPELVKQGRKGKLRGSRSKLLGNRENECRVRIDPPKRVENKINKMREEIAANRALRNRLAFVIRNPEMKAGAIKSDGTIQPRIAAGKTKGQFLAKVKVVY